MATLAGFVQGELNWGLFTALEQQVISGNGTGENMTGLLNTSGVLTQSFGADLLATLRSAITKVESTGFAPDVIALSPADWETIETSQTSGSGEYLFASSPVDRAARKVWGVQVALSRHSRKVKRCYLSRDTVALYTDGRIAYDLDKSQGFSTNEVVARRRRTLGPRGPATLRHRLDCHRCQRRLAGTASPGYGSTPPSPSSAGSICVSLASG